jgi:hypothetical protein
VREALVREFERHLLSEAYQVPFLWLNGTVSPSPVGAPFQPPPEDEAPASGRLLGKNTPDDQTQKIPRGRGPPETPI